MIQPKEITAAVLAAAIELKKKGATSEQIQAAMLGLCASVAVYSGVSEEDFKKACTIMYQGYVKKIHSQG